MSLDREPCKYEQRDSAYCNYVSEAFGGFIALLEKAIYVVN